MDYSKLGNTDKYGGWGGTPPAQSGTDYGAYGGGPGGKADNFVGGKIFPAEKLFLDYNQKRIKIATQIAPQKSSLAIQLVPVLLHFNHASLPGHVECKEYCGGIAQFQFTEEMKQTTSSIIQDYKTIEKDLIYARIPRTMIESVLLMGSVGSAAQSAGSDFDYWVVVDETKFQPGDKDRLQKKLVTIEKWAEKQGAEVHFFITDLNRVRVNDFGTADKESAGSSLARLLKEEFYRTCLHVSGKYPFWWLTPPSISDADYEATLKKMTAAQDFPKHKFIDLGNIEGISTGEIFGAALWQINKAMESPYKSVMKIALLESFIDQQGEKMLLCDELKKNVLAQSREPEDLDPYLIMINRLLDLYERKNRPDVVTLMRKCFYNKVHIKITPAVRKKEKTAFKEEVMIRYIADWKWDEATVNHLNDYENWDFETMLKLGNELHAFLLETYKNVTDTLKAQADATSNISDSDLTVLGRKLFAFYSRKPGKIEPIKRASDDAAKQESLTFMPTVVPGKKTVWYCYRGNVQAEVARKANLDHALIRKSNSLADLVSWLTINTVIDAGTFLHLITNPLPVHLKTIQELVKLINDFMPYQSISSLKNESLLKAPEVTGMIVVVNFVSPPWSKDFEEVTVLYRNSHGERFCETLEPKTAPVRLAEIAGQAHAPAVVSPLDFFRIYISKSEGAPRLEKLVRNLLMSKTKKA